MAAQKSILICPLDWGLGHASRMVPIIKRLDARGHRVVIAADGAGLGFLQDYFPELEFIRFPGFKPQYSRGNSQVFQMMRSMPKALKSFKEDHQFVEKLISSQKIDGLISDNRFGAYTNQVPSVFITHQLHIRIPAFWIFLKPLVDAINIHYIKRFNQVWVPDNLHEPRLSGKLSFPAFPDFDTYYIGVLSRFSPPEQNHEKDIDMLFLLSGPEPQRSLLEEKIIVQSTHLEASFCLLRGVPGKNNTPYHLHKNLLAYDHADDKTFSALIQRAKTIVARAGYSSIMDLTAFGRSAWLIPTPGQTEQEYLAAYLNEKQWFKTINQQQFDLAEILNSSISENQELSTAPKPINFEVIDNWADSL
ncbi:MAG: hypothetical protein K8F24_03200 [Bacteroidales bacterium]|nr:hypothetical protein [Bacteroidales bacterium]